MECHKDISKKIKKLIYKEKYEEALELCSEDICQNDMILLSQRITILIRLERFEDALKLCSEEACQKDIIILKQKIDILIQLDRLDEADSLIPFNCQNNYLRKQKQTINEIKEEKKLIITEKYIELSKKIKKIMSKDTYEALEEALSLCTEDAIKNNEAILSQKVSILIRLRRLDEAEELIPENTRNGYLLNQKQTIIDIREGRKQFISKRFTKLSKHIKKLMYEEKYEEALSLCSEEICEENLTILSMKVIILMELNRFEEAEAIIPPNCTQESLLNQKQALIDIREGKKQYIPKKYLQLSKKIRMLIYDKKFEEALLLCSEDAIKNNKYILSQKIDILSELYGLKEEVKNFRKEQSEEDILVFINDLIELKETINNNPTSPETVLITKLYADLLTESDIKDSDIDEWNKNILLIGYYQKNDKKRGIKLIKELKNNESNNDRIKTLNKLMTLLENKLSFFDIHVYEQIVGTSVDFNHIEEYVIDKEKEEEKNVLIKDYYQREVLKLKKILCVEMQGEYNLDTTKDLETLENIINEKMDNREALEKFQDLLIRTRIINNEIDEQEYKR